MTTFSGRLTLADGTEIDYTGDAPPQTRLGMCPVNSTSVTDIRAVFQRFPATKTLRFFSAGNFVPWDSPLFAAIPAGVHLVYSVKGVGLNWQQAFTTLPTRWFGLIDFIWQHEPEQQDSGDPTPAVFQAEWRKIGQAAAAHPLNDKFRVGPCFTEFRARADGETWFNQFGVVGTYEGINRAGFDIYNTGYPQFTNYRTPAHISEIPFAYADRTGLQVSVDELGLARKNDPNGTICAQSLPGIYERLQTRCRTVTWFDRGACYLGDSPTDPAGRRPEYAVMADLIEEAA